MGAFMTECEMFNVSASRRIAQNLAKCPTCIPITQKIVYSKIFVAPVVVVFNARVVCSGR